jgi:uncharacterized protein (TIGR03437 family)
MIRRCLPFLLFASFAIANPVIGTDGIVNVASYQPSGFPNSGIAQGSLFVVFGSGLGPSTLAGLGGFPIPTELAGTSIRVTVNGVTKDALMIYTSAGQVAALLPSSTPTGDGTLTLTYNGSASNPAPIHVVANSFGIFTVNQGGTGPSVTTFPNTNPARAVSLLDSAQPGQIYTLWGTGLGAVSGDESQPSAGGDLKSKLGVKIYVGNQPAVIEYAGRSPGSTGLDQINFTVPANLSGCFVPIAVQVKGVISNFPSISIAPHGGTCSDPAGPMNEVLQRVDSGQGVRIGLVQLNRFSPKFTLAQLGDIVVNQDTGAGYFYNVSPQQFMGGLGVAALNTLSGCVVWTCRGGTCVPPTESAAVPQLDAGSSLSVSGPLGQKTMNKAAGGAYVATLGGGDLTTPAFLDPGSYTLSASGGSGSSAVGSFSASQTVSATPVTFTSPQLLSPGADIDRTRDVTINWQGGDANGYIAIIGASTSGDSTQPSTQVTGTFGCTAKGASGSFTVPSWVLSALPPTGTLTQSNIQVSNGFFLVGKYPEFHAFSATGLDKAYFSNLVLSGLNTVYK